MPAQFTGDCSHIVVVYSLVEMKTVVDAANRANECEILPRPAVHTVMHNELHASSARAPSVELTKRTRSHSFIIDLPWVCS